MPIKLNNYKDELRTILATGTIKIAFLFLNEVKKTH